MTERFGKAYRISGVEATTTLFQSGQFISAPGLNMRVQTMSSSEGEIAFLISVPKRKLRRAVDRNRVRRQIREALRKNKIGIETFAQKEKLSIRIGLVYQYNLIKSTHAIENDIIQALDKVLKRIEKQRKR